MVSSYVYTGLWVNHSREKLLGTTLTLTDKNGAVLVAFLATLVTAAGHAAWTILRYIFHQLRASDKPHDALFYQQQAALKNSSSALGTALTFLRMSWAWRKHERRMIWRSWTLLFVTLAVIISAIFTAAAIFSSQVTQTAGTAFLVRSSDCGLWDFPNDKTTGWQIKTLNDTHTAQNYARTCYQGGSGSSRLCDKYKVPEIKWHTDRNADCPFAAETCYNLSTPISMDTGYLDSHKIFGLNAVPEERVVVRKKTTCSPLRLRNWVAAVNTTLGDPSDPVTDPFIQVYIGGVNENDPANAVIARNYTYRWNAHNVFMERGYELQTVYAHAGYKNGWDPISEFNRTDADVTVFFLAQNSMLYDFPNSDALFGANTVLPDNNNYSATEIPVKVYQPDRIITGLGCVDQFQICNPVIPGPDSTNGMLCTPLDAIIPLYRKMSTLQFSAHQFETWKPIWRGMQYAGMDKVADGMDSSALKAQETVSNRFQTAKLPNDQWVVELAAWNAITLARVQATVLEYATGPSNVVEQRGRIIKPKVDDKVGQNICKRQLILNVAGYQNFNMLGVTLILVISSILILVGWTVDIIVGWIQKWMGKHYARLSWVQDGYLQLQRMAYEGAGHAGWEGSADDVPLTRGRTREEQVLMGLDLGDLRHPRLRGFEHSLGDGVQEKMAGVSVLEQSERTVSRDSRGRRGLLRICEGSSIV
ncbi:hypothetical protein B0J14DRAFT_686453 [Halenospora varia]|nr:hypothetical protein B0J14DRAFT_686453 [Halenospora varia]